LLTEVGNRYDSSEVEGEGEGDEDDDEEEIAAKPGKYIDTHQPSSIHPYANPPQNSNETYPPHLLAPSAAKKRKTTKDAAPAEAEDEEDDDEEGPGEEDDEEVDPADLDDEEEAADPDDEDANEDADDTADKSGPAAAAKKAKERTVPGGKDKAEVGDIKNAEEKDGGL
jgi:hypothetical protein